MKILNIDMLLFFLIYVYLVVHPFRNGECTSNFTNALSVNQVVHGIAKITKCSCWASSIYMNLWVWFEMEG